MKWHKVQHCNNDNNYNDDNMMRATVWFEFFVGVFSCQNLGYMREEHDDKLWDLNCEHLFPRALGHKRRSDMKEVDIMEFRV